MPWPQKRHQKKGGLILTVAGVAAGLTFFFYDGPLPLIQPEAAYSSTAEQAEIGPSAMHADNPASESADFWLGGITPQWHSARLDNNALTLQILQQPILLKDSAQGTGSEAFFYASFLLEQMAESFKQNELSQKLATLSMKAQTLGHALHQASTFRYEGLPSESLEHLQVRSSIQSYLDELRTNALISAHYNQSGQLLKQDGNNNHATRNGQALNEFLRGINEVLQDPNAQHYPETLALLRQEAHILQQLANHLSLRWESTQYCQATGCNGIATYFRVYLHQDLPDNTPVAVAASDLHSS